MVRLSVQVVALGEAGGVLVTVGDGQKREDEERV